MKLRNNSNPNQRKRIGNPNQRKRSDAYYKRNSSPYQRDSNSNNRSRIKRKRNNPNQRARIRTKNNPNQRRMSNSSYRRMNSQQYYGRNSQPSQSRGFNSNSIVVVVIILAFIIGAGMGVSQIFAVNHSDDNKTQVTYQDVTNNVSYYENLSANSSSDYYDPYSDSGEITYNDSSLNVYNDSYFGSGPLSD